MRIPTHIATAVCVLLSAVQGMAADDGAPPARNIFEEATPEDIPALLTILRTESICSTQRPRAATAALVGLGKPAIAPAKPI